MTFATGATLELRDVGVVRGGARILEGISLALRRGEIVAVIGPNGAGKSTLLEAAIGAVPLATGAVSIAGSQTLSFATRSSALAYLAGEAEPPHEVRVGTLLDSLDGRDRDWGRLLERELALAALRTARVGTLSRGERRRLALFETLALDKPFVLLDEPTGVFDPVQLVEVVELFRTAARRGAGLLVTVHQMSDAEALGARIVLLNRGRVCATGTLDELRAAAGLGGSAGLREVFLALLRREDGRAPA